jgi:hypothetical protein
MMLTRENRCTWKNAFSSPTLSTKTPYLLPTGLEKNQVLGYERPNRILTASAMTWPLPREEVGGYSERWYLSTKLHSVTPKKMILLNLLKPSGNFTYDQV